MSPEYRARTCPDCGGDGGFDEAYIRNDHSVGHYSSVCSYCDGTGDVIVEVEPVTEEEIMECA